VGCGLHLESGEVLTTSHVVNLALGTSARSTRSQTGQTLTIDFPLVSGTPSFDATVSRWTSPLDEDVATVRIVRDPSFSGARLDPTLGPVAGSEVSIFGCPDSFPDGVWARGAVVGPVTRGRWQVDQHATNNHRIASGFSGAGVWLDDQTVIGLVWGGQPAGDCAHISPPALLGSRRTVVGLRRGDPAWRLDHVFRDTLTGLLNDLVMRERDGLEPEQCDVVKYALKKLRNQLEVIEGSAAWTNPPHKIAARLETTYERWNGFQQGPDGAGQRDLALHELRKVRRSLKTGSEHYRTTLFEDRLADDADSMINHMEDLTTIMSGDRHLFPHVRESILKYRKAVS